jgi:hypothetical protein
MVRPGIPIPDLARRLILKSGLHATPGNAFLTSRSCEPGFRNSIIRGFANRRGTEGVETTEDLCPAFLMGIAGFLSISEASDFPVPPLW